MVTFEQAVSDSDVVFIVGSGTSAAISNNAATSTWKGLIESGASRAMLLRPELGDDWAELVDRMLSFGTSNGSTSMFVNAAGLVADTLRDLGEVAFASWLEEDIGGLEVRSAGVARALLAYPFPILTTNYDTLLEEVGKREAADWTDPKRFHDVVARKSDAIGHIHGVWNRPASVVLSESDYERLRVHPSTQALQQAMASLKSIIYVGFGGGLSDPNFARLLDWHRKTLPESSVTHFRLCKSSELDGLRRLHADEHVVPVAYGDSYDSLQGFLESNVPSTSVLATNEAGLAMDIVQDVRRLLRDSMTNESVLVEAGGADLIREDLVIAPVLLPVAHATFVREQFRSRGEGEVERLDGHTEVLSHDFFLVVGDEGAGLTTTIKWLATESSEVLGSAAPLFVRFADCRIRSNPLGAAVAEAAMSSGLIRDRKSPLPPHVIAVDDVAPNLPRMSDAVLAQIVSSPAIVKVLGCRQGDEDELTSKLRSLGVTPRVLFLGRMRKSDIALLAEKLAPGQGASLAEDASRILDAENLRRTPMTVCLLLYLLLRGGTLDARNQTSMLDAFTSLLLGIGNPHENSTGLTETDLEAVLANFAEATIWDEKPALSEHEAVRVVGEVLTRFGWAGNPSKVLDFFLQRRLLRRHGDSIEFARYSYLTLFAAKRAAVDPEFRELVVNDLFYYQPVAVKLAALVRSDENLLERLVPILQEELAQTDVVGSPYEPIILKTIDRLPEPAGDTEDAVAASPREEGELEFPEGTGTGSFGLVKDEMPLSSRMHRSLSLISNVLRELDQVENLTLKRSLLVGTIELWGRFITAMSTDSWLADLKSAIAGKGGLALEGSAPIDDDLMDFLSKSIPPGAALAGMDMTLVSPKLTTILDESLREGDLSESQESITATLLFLLLLKPHGWAEKSLPLVATARPTWVITHFHHALCQNTFVQGAEPEDAILNLCKTLYMKGRTFSSPQIRDAHLDRYVQTMRNSRARNRLSSRAQE